MKAGKLKAILKDVPDDMDVWTYVEIGEDYDACYGAFVVRDKKQEPYAKGDTASGCGQPFPYLLIGAKAR